MNRGDRFSPPSAELIRLDVERAFAEDIGTGDATADLLPESAQATAVLTCRERAVLAGRPWFDACFRALDPEVRIDWMHHDGDVLDADRAICTLHGRARALVTAERSALNFLQLLSGTATVTALHVAALSGTRTRLLDTRKTIPGLRLAQKYAVRCGGGLNHRIGLYDGVLIKENHIITAGSIRAAVTAARRMHPALPLEVEVENLDELVEAIDAGADRIMIDNFELPAMRDAVRITAGRAALEVSGNVGVENLAAIGATGVDFVSVGALTKHVHAVDLSLRLRID